MMEKTEILLVIFLLLGSFYLVIAWGAGKKRSENPKIRKYLFDHVNPDWLRSDIIGEIFDKIYIHLHSEHIPEAGLIMDELSNQNQRNKLAEIIFDLEKLDFTLAGSQDCIKRLEESWINLHLKKLREDLKNAEITKQDSIHIMKKIEDFQIQKKKLSYQNEISES